MDRYGYRDVITEDGSLVPPTTLAPKRPYEVVEAMYGMIHLLANEIAQTEPISVEEIIQSAADNYQKGLVLADPTGDCGSPMCPKMSPLSLTRTSSGGC